MPSFTLLAPQSTTGATLDALAGDSLIVDGDPQTRVRSVTVDSREVHQGGLFAALPGYSSHGADHVFAAAAAGAVAILTDPAGWARARRTGLPVLIAPDPRGVLGIIAATVYGTRRSVSRVFGVTGTNGKTTTVHLLDAILGQLGVPCGRSSTSDRRSGDSIVASRLTSPEAPELHALLARMAEDGAQAAVLEVSAQALTRHRVDGVLFDVVGFTNLSHDHRDDYPTEREYLAAKVELFQPSRSRCGVVLLDSPAGHRVRTLARIPVTTVTSRDNVDTQWRVTVTAEGVLRTDFTLTGPGGQHLTTSIPLLGRHMAADCGLALVMLTTAGFDIDLLADTLRHGVEVTVPGRSDLLSGSRGPRVYMDFSHTPDSIQKTLAAVRQVTPGKVLVIVGADGDRDPTKRVPMGRAASLGADVVIVTDHHPRFEDPEAIRRALVDGATSGLPDHRVLEIADPATAIRAAIALAGEDDTILWVGPGQTDYRVVRGADLPYSPRADTRRALIEAGWGERAS